LFSFFAIVTRRHTALIESHLFKEVTVPQESQSWIWSSGESSIAWASETS